MSVLVTLVIFCFVILALVGNKFGIRQFMAVGLLPFVILTMTIERFFVVVEEHGLRIALQTALGSAIVSVIAYLILQWEILQITFFVYPELLLFVMGLQILVGRYTGYRLSELFRFRSFGGRSMMFLTRFRNLREAGILGINKRNAEIIMAYNPRAFSGCRQQGAHKGTGGPA